MALVGWTLCQSHDTPMGLGPPVTEDGVWEDWCDFPGDRWDILTLDRGDLEGICANFGSQLRFTPEDPYDGTDPVPQFYIRSEPINLNGRQLIFRYRPSDATRSFSFLELNWWMAVRLEWNVQGSSKSLYLSAGDFDVSSFQETTLSGADFDGAHAWIRIVEDRDLSELRIYTSAYCEDWTLRLTVAAGSRSLASPTFDFFGFVGDVEGSGGQVLPPAWLSPLYILPTNPEPEES